jgi:hypothetical protein
MTAMASVVHRGRRVWHLEAELLDEGGRLVATAHGTRPPWDPTEKGLYVDYPRRCQALGQLRPRQGDPGGGMMRPPQLAAQEIEP